MSQNSDFKQFNFGKNWDSFSKTALTSDKIRQAKDSFNELNQGSDIRNKTFIDIGFGQGLTLLIASELGAKTVGNDINPICKKVLISNRNKFFNDLATIEIPVVVGSILNEATITSIQQINYQYDIVHSWGVLHHTGKMWNAIKQCSNLVKENGKYIIAIYNKHWSSPVWRIIKRTYIHSPVFLRKLMIFVFYTIIYISKFLVTFKNPLIKERGMSFYYDIIDWIGGYPYEYASKEEIQNYVEKLGFRLVNFKKAQVPTGCNEFVFVKI